VTPRESSDMENQIKDDHKLQRNFSVTDVIAV